MEKWQENRNYRKIRDENGTVIANIITVDGRDVAVTEDVFAAYAQMDRRERYLSEDLPTGKVLSLEQMAEDGVLPDYVGAETAPSAEDCVLARESERGRLSPWRTGTGSSSPRCSTTTSPPENTPGESA